MDELKACVAKVLSDNFPAYADWLPDCNSDATAEDWGDFLAHVAHVIARDDQLKTSRKDRDRFAAIVNGFAASVEGREMLTRRYLRLTESRGRE